MIFYNSLIFFFKSSSLTVRFVNSFFISVMVFFISLIAFSEYFPLFSNSCFNFWIYLSFKLIVSEVAWFAFSSSFIFSFISFKFRISLSKEFFSLVVFYNSCFKRMFSFFTFSTYDCTSRISFFLKDNYWLSSFRDSLSLLIDASCCSTIKVFKSISLFKPIIFYFSSFISFKYFSFAFLPLSPTSCNLN